MTLTVSTVERRRLGLSEASAEILGIRAEKDPKKKPKEPAAKDPEKDPEEEPEEEPSDDPDGPEEDPEDDPDDDDEEKEGRFRGYAALFNSRTAIGNPLTWGFYEEIADGAFTKTLSEGDARMLIDHDTYYVVSRVSAGTLALSQDKTGLLADSALDPALSYVADLTANLRNGNITGMSFGFQVIKDDWLMEDVSTSDGQKAQVEVRILRELRLLEVSPVTFPAYEDTSAGLRAVQAALVHRADARAIESRAAHRPELRDLLPLIDTGEPAAATRRHAREPAESTRSLDAAQRRMRALAARYPALRG